MGGCNSKVYAKSYCERHYTQIRRHGKILERTRYEPNEVIDYGDYAAICLYNMKQEKVAVTKIDKDDIAKIREYKWCIVSSGDIVADKNGERYALHRFLMNAPSNAQVDHIDRDRSNNRKQNLRVCSHRENSRNQDIRKDNTSGFPGVIWSKRDERWVARINYNGRLIHIGNFVNFEGAVSARIEAERRYFKDFAPRR